MNGSHFLAVRTSAPNPKKGTRRCRFGDLVAIDTWIDAFEGRKFTVKHEMKNGEHLAATCREHRAWVVLDPGSPRGITAVPVPEEIRRLFHHAA